MQLSRTILVVLATLAFPTPALACSVIVPEGYEGSAKQVRDVRQAIANSTAIIDGTVVKPYIEGRQNALVLAHRVFKGPAGPWFEIGDDNKNSCAIVLNRPKARMRMLLSGGPRVFALRRDQSEARLEDRFLRSNRRREFPYFHGDEATPAGIMRD